MLKEDNRNGNHLLAVLDESEWARVAPHLVPVDMSLGQVIYEAGDRLSHVYFPATSIVSLLYVLENGASAEIAVVGNEGLIGIALFMGGATSVAALYPGIDHADGPDRRVQPAPLN